jgi:hypothetical protein
VGEAPSLAAAALAFGLRVITFDQGLYQEMIAYEGQHSGLLMPMADTSGTIVDHLVIAMQEYLMKPELRVSHRKTARALFKSRYAINRTAALCSEAYVEASSPSRFSTGARTDAPVTSNDRWTPTPHIRLDDARRSSSRRRVPEPQP